MTEEEKALIMNFVGQTYGQSHKNDQMIVGQSNSLTPQSELVKQQFESIARAPTQQQQVQTPPIAPQEPQPQPVQEAPPVSYEQAVRELQEAEPVPIVEEQNGNQLEFNLKDPEKIDMLIDAIKSNGLLLKEIILLLEKNGRRKKPSDKKPG
jgi:hypothetical protein|tara:strand:+ start:2774 stop:3229 length:456 start_codon:yes stop_codon:yes gene_type:complete